MSTTAARPGEPFPDPPETTLDGLLLRPGPETGRRTALIDAATGERWTHRELSDRALTAASAFRRAGIVPGERVVLCLPNGIDYVTGLFGLLAAGTVVSPVLHDAPAAELAARDASVGASAPDGGAGERTGELLLYGPQVAGGHLAVDGGLDPVTDDEGWPPATWSGSTATAASGSSTASRTWSSTGATRSPPARSRGSCAPIPWSATPSPSPNRTPGTAKSRWPGWC
ncbi:AMP-binding protein [Streptomyces sp. JNUCC 64]